MEAIDCRCARHAGLGRRGALLGLAGLGLGSLGSAPSPAQAAEPPPFEAMLLSCIDPRFVGPVYGYMAGAASAANTAISA